MNRRTDSSSWKILSTSIESPGAGSQSRWSPCARPSRGGSTSAARDWTSAGAFLRGAPSAFGLMIPDNRQRSRPFHDDCGGFRASTWPTNRLPALATNVKRVSAEDDRPLAGHDGRAWNILHLRPILHFGSEVAHNREVWNRW